MTSTRDTRPADPATAEFCTYLKSGREERSLTLAQIARITKVPKPSLERIEAGEFDKLPAEVFVRGFLRSYAQCVGLDPDDVIRRYVDTRADGAEDGPEGKTRARVADARAKDEAKAARKDEPAPSAATADDASDGKRSRLHATGSFITRNFFDAEPAESRRGAVTLAVIILVIVATITMSYLLRRPSYSGDGVTRAPSDGSIGLPGLIESSARAAENRPSV